MSSVTSQVSGIGSEIETIRAKLTGTEMGMSLLGVNHATLLYSWQLNQYKTSLDMLVALNDKLPYGEQCSLDLKKISEEIAVENLFHDIGVMSAHAAARAAPDGVMIRPPLSNEIANSLFNLGVGMTALYQETDRTNHTLIENAQKLSRHRESSFVIATWVSYLLYATGWLISLIGRLYGIDGLDGD